MVNLTTQQICRAFSLDPTRNPVTGRKIKIGAKTHRNLQALCIGVEYQQELQLPDEVLNYPLYDDVVNYIMEFIDFDSCEYITEGGKLCKNLQHGKTEEYFDEERGYMRDKHCFDYCDERIGQWYPHAAASLDLFRYDFKMMKKDDIRKVLERFGMQLPRKASRLEHIKAALDLVKYMKEQAGGQEIVGDPGHYDLNALGVKFRRHFYGEDVFEDAAASRYFPWNRSRSPSYDRR